MFKFEHIEDYINHYGKELKQRGNLSLTWLMMELMNELNDNELEDLNVDLIEVADLVITYVESGEL